MARLLQIVTALAVVALAPTAALAQPKAPEAKAPVPKVPEAKTDSNTVKLPSIETFTLPNGLQVHAQNEMDVTSLYQEITARDLGYLALALRNSASFSAISDSPA